MLYKSSAYPWSSSQSRFHVAPRETKEKADLSDKDGERGCSSVAAHERVREKESDESQLQEAHTDLCVCVCVCVCVWVNTEYT